MSSQLSQAPQFIALGSSWVPHNILENLLNIYNIMQNLNDFLELKNICKIIYMLKVVMTGFCLSNL